MPPQNVHPLGFISCVVVHPIAVPDRLAHASLRQRNADFSSGGVVFRDRYQASAEWARVEKPTPSPSMAVSVSIQAARVGMHTFGSSAPLEVLLTKFGFTPAKVLAAAKEKIAKSKRTTL